MPVLRFIHIEWRELRVAVAGRLRDRPGIRVPVNRRLTERGNGVVHRHVEELALAGALCVQQCTDDSERGHRARVEIADAGADFEDLALVRTSHADNATHGLRDDIVGGPLGIWAFPGPRVAEAPDSGVDQPRVSLVNGLVAKAEAVHDANAEVLDNSVCCIDEGEHAFAFGWLFEVDDHAALVAVDACEVAAEGLLRIAFWKRLAEAAEVAFGRLDLDDIRAEVCQEHRAKRPGERAREVDYSDANQRAGRGFRHRRDRK